MLPWFALGSFRVVGPTLILSDPGYAPEPSLRRSASAEISSAVPGPWIALVRTHSDGDDWVCAELVAHAACVSFPPPTPWEPVETISVDSGQAGLFDRSTYRGGAQASDAQAQAWFQRCCAETASTMKAGLVPHGAVARSGYGDGGYPVSRVTIDGRVVAVRIVFISEP